MENFDVDDYCTKLSNRRELFKMEKDNLVAIAQYYEVATGPRTKVTEAIQLIGDRLNLPDPEKEAAARLRREEENRKVEMEKIELEREKL